EEKGVSTLFQSARENSDIRHLIVGTGPLEQSLKQEASALSLENVEFLGFRQGNELKKLLSEATCVVVPSEWYENCPMTILEAFAAGRPVIGADIGGIPELIEQGQDGFTFEPKNAAALAERVRWVWENRSLAREMGMAGRAKILEKFNAEQHYEGLMSVYKAVL
ncbi:MAG: glycosyltransferase family 4 protein, partial [Halioglobus sp.]|nr:glycosyltransferase family 4 protein [Halioglobus sp.]